MDLKLNNKVVFISASTQGLGLACAKEFLQEGARVVINGRDSKKLARAHKTLSKKFKNNIMSVVGDVTDRDTLDIIKSTILERWKRVDVIIPNLGSGKPQGSNKLDTNEWQEFFDVNVKSVVEMIDTFLPIMKKQKKGSLVIISSITGIESTAAPFGYASAKASLLTLMKNLSHEVASFGIRVNAVAPGNIYFKGGRWEEIIKNNPGVIKDYIEKDVPMKRLGAPEEVARTVVFISSDISSFTTGSYLAIDGGETKSY